MNILNIYFSSTGNTEKVALKIKETLREMGHNVETVKITDEDDSVDVLKYDFVFVGSGVYGQLPGTPLIDLHRRLLQKYSAEGEVKPASPRRSSARVVVYCTYGGVHTGINEAIPAVKYMGQLYDHLGYTIVGEWYVVGEYRTEALRDRSIKGRLGDIRGRPSEADLHDVAEKVKGILKALSS
jgi:multimeric flavodoxin WrbA